MSGFRNCFLIYYIGIKVVFEVKASGILCIVRFNSKKKEREKVIQDNTSVLLSHLANICHKY